jgi:hypothetical protein
MSVDDLPRLDPASREHETLRAQER